MKQYKNFSVLLKAAIDKKMQEAGVFHFWLECSKDHEEYTKSKESFFESLDDITLNYLQGVKTQFPPDDESPSGSEALPSSTPQSVEGKEQDSEMWHPNYYPHQSVEGQIQKQLAEKGNQLGSIVGTIPDLPMSDAFDSYKEKYGTDAAVGHAFKKGAEFGYSQLVGDKEREIEEWKHAADSFELTAKEFKKEIQFLNDRNEYWKARCEAAEVIYQLLNSNIDHKQEYKTWQALKQQPIK